MFILSFHFSNFKLFLKIQYNKHWITEIPHSGITWISLEILPSFLPSLKLKLKQQTWLVGLQWCISLAEADSFPLCHQKHSWWAPSPSPPAKTQRRPGTAWSSSYGKKKLQVPLKCCILHASKDSCYLLTYKNVTPASQSRALMLSDTLPLTTSDGQSHWNAVTSSLPQKGMCFAFAPGSFREGALGFSVFGEGTTQDVLGKHRGSRSPCVTTEEASTNRQMFWMMAVQMHMETCLNSLGLLSPFLVQPVKG